MNRIQPRVHQDHACKDHVCGCDVGMTCDEATRNH